jgi:uncharacterized membrane protein (DUF2068 family)
MTEPADQRPPKKRDWILISIGILKVIKATLLITLAIVALKLVHKDVGHEIGQWLVDFRLDPSNRLIRRLIRSLWNVDDHHLHLIATGSLIYAGLLSTEATGLLMQKRWGEYFTVLITGSFIPFEIYELAIGVTVVKSVVAVLNIAIVIYLIGRLIADSPGRNKEFA